MLTLIDMHAKFPTEEACAKCLAAVRWNGRPICPYCGAECHWPAPGKTRYTCTPCNTHFTVTVGTVFEGAKIDLRKLCLAIHTLVYTRRKVPNRSLAAQIGVSKNTANYMAIRVRTGLLKEREFVLAIAEEVEK